MVTKVKSYTVKLNRVLFRAVRFMILPLIRAEIERGQNLPSSRARNSETHFSARGETGKKLKTDTD